MLNALIYTRIYQSVKFLSVAITSLVFMVYMIKNFKKYDDKVLLIAEYVLPVALFGAFFYLFGGFVSYFSELLQFLKIYYGKIIHTLALENNLQAIAESSPYLYDTLPLLFRKIFTLELFWALMSFCFLLILKVVFAENNTEKNCIVNFLKNSWKKWLYSLIISIFAYWIIAIIIIAIA